MDAMSEPKTVFALAPCPFCGGADAKFIYSGWGQAALVECVNKDCGAQGPIKDSARDGFEREAVAAWNTRAATKPTRRRVE